MKIFGTVLKDVTGKVEEDVTVERALNNISRITEKDLK